MKIDIKEYRKAIEMDIINSVDISITQLSDVMNCMIKFIDTNLKCKVCNKVMPDASFSKSRQQVNRRGRYPVCKTCFKEYIGYGTNKEEKDESGN